MEVTAIKVCEFLKLCFIPYGDSAPVKVEHSFVPQLLDDAVRVHSRNTQGIAELFLGHRHIECIILYASDDSEALTKLHYHVSKSVWSGPLPDIYNPLSEQGGVYERVAPQ
jgi:hypothetical protein